jgi:subtilisin family serine protease
MRFISSFLLGIVLVVGMVSQQHALAAPPCFVDTIVNDEYFYPTKKWHQDFTRVTSGAWDLSTGDDTVVAVLDTAIDRLHPDLVNNIWTNSGEVAGNSIDDDGNGYIDDVYGYDFIENDNEVRDGDDGHGTAIAGLVAAEGNNSIGIVGTAPCAKVMPVRVAHFSDGLRGNTANLSVLHEGITYAMNNGADVILISTAVKVSASSSYTGIYQSIRTVIQQAIDNGIVVIAAAGDEDKDIHDYYDDGGSTIVFPAAVSSLITVGASDDSKHKDNRSNYGDAVTLNAPSGEECCTGEEVPSNYITVHVLGHLFTLKTLFNEEFHSFDSVPSLYPSCGYGVPFIKRFTVLSDGTYAFYSTPASLGWITPPGETLVVTVNAIGDHRVFDNDCSGRYAYIGGSAVAAAQVAAAAALVKSINPNLTHALVESELFDNSTGTGVPSTEDIGRLVDINASVGNICTTQPPTLGVPTITSPLSITNYDSNESTLVVWTAVEAAHSYILRLQDVATGQYTYYQNITGTSYTFEPEDLGGSQFRVWVRAVTPCAFGTYSNGETFTTQLDTPTLTVNPAIVDHVTSGIDYVTTVTPDFSWNTIDGADEYRIFVRTWVWEGGSTTYSDLCDIDGNPGTPDATCAINLAAPTTTYTMPFAIEGDSSNPTRTVKYQIWVRAKNTGSTGTNVLGPWSPSKVVKLNQ